MGWIVAIIIAIIAIIVTVRNMRLIEKVTGMEEQIERMDNEKNFVVTYSKDSDAMGGYAPELKIMRLFTPESIVGVYSNKDAARTAIKYKEMEIQAQSGWMPNVDGDIDGVGEWTAYGPDEESF